MLNIQELKKFKGSIELSYSNPVKKLMLGSIAFFELILVILIILLKLHQKEEFNIKSTPNIIFLSCVIALMTVALFIGYIIMNEKKNLTALEKPDNLIIVSEKILEIKEQPNNQHYYDDFYIINRNLNENHKVGNYNINDIAYYYRRSCYQDKKVYSGKFSLCNGNELILNGNIDNQGNIKLERKLISSIEYTEKLIPIELQKIIKEQYQSLRKESLEQNGGKYELILRRKSATILTKLPNCILNLLKINMKHTITVSPKNS